MSRKRAAIGVGLVWFLLLLYFRPAVSDDRSLQRREAVQAAKLLKVVRDLAAPEMEGRAAGTAGEKKAAQYIAKQFQRIGIKPPEESGELSSDF